MQKNKITQEELKEILDYNSDTGVFTWKIFKTNKVKSGVRAGYLDSCGYNIIGINGKNQKAHRLAWLYVYGEFPQGQIDHINGNRSDNRIENLRDVSHSQNQQNRKEHRQGQLLGASFHKPLIKWRSQISINGVKKHLGVYNTEQQAHEAYLNYIKENDLCKK